MNKNDPRTHRLPGELERHFEEQVAMLIDRCEAFYEGKFYEGKFYEGKFYEAKSAAGILYILLCDHGGSQKSLLGELGIKDKTKFLDSRHTRHGLCLNTAKGAWPTTTWPEKPHRNKDFFGFNEWWTKQSFKVFFKDIEFTRQELVEAIRNKEGGGHVDPLTPKKIAAVRRSRSGWQRSVKDNEDGTTQMYVGISLTREPLRDDSALQEISDYELCCVCAIAEEVLFSLTPEPKNRERMIVENLQKPFYLTQEESNACKEAIREDIEKMKVLTGLSLGTESIVLALKKAMEKVLEIECLTSEDYDIREHVAQQLKFFKVELED